MRLAAIGSAKLPCAVTLHARDGAKHPWLSLTEHQIELRLRQKQDTARHSNNSPPTTSSVTMKTFLGVTYTAYRRMQWT